MGNTIAPRQTDLRADDSHSVKHCESALPYEAALDTEQTHGPTAPAGERFSIAIVDDDESVRRTMELMIRKLFSLANIAVYSSAEEALETFTLKVPDVVLLDLNMQGMSGLDCAHFIRKRFPSARVVILTGYLRPEYVSKALYEGAMGYLLKPPAMADVRMAIQGAIEGRIVLSEGTRRLFALPNSLDTKESPVVDCKLTPQERRVLTKISNGLTDLAIAKEMHISENTVKWHVKHLLRKLGASCRAEAVARCVQCSGFLFGIDLG